MKLIVNLKKNKNKVRFIASYFLKYTSTTVTAKKPTIELDIVIFANS